MENLSTLLGKYGDEGDKLLFKILNSGDAFSKVQPDELANSNALSLKVCEKGLRYDLTVPFARYVVQHQNELAFPFKRYQIQPVWRADRPQKGRYREFYQCDVDVIGSKSLINELELVQIVDEVFAKFGINVCIKINNRKVLQGLAEVIGHPDKLIDITVAIDKIDKIGLDAVKEELLARGIDENGICSTKLCSVYHKSLIENSIVQHHWAGRSTRGVVQFDGKTINTILNDDHFKNDIDSDIALNYVNGLLAK